MRNPRPHPHARLDQDRQAADGGKGGGWQAYLDGVAREHAPIKRFARPQELANVFVFLCSELGSTYFVDGGILKTV